MALLSDSFNKFKFSILPANFSHLDFIVEDLLPPSIEIHIDSTTKWFRIVSKHRRGTIRQREKRKVVSSCCVSHELVHFYKFTERVENISIHILVLDEWRSQKKFLCANKSYKWYWNLRSASDKSSCTEKENEISNFRVFPCGADSLFREQWSMASRCSRTRNDQSE